MPASNGREGRDTGKPGAIRFRNGSSFEKDMRMARFDAFAGS